MAQLKLVRLQDLQAPRIPTPRHQNAHTDWPILHQYHHFAFTSSIFKSLLVAQLVQDFFAAKINQSLCFSDSPWLFERCPSAFTWNFHPWCDIAGNSVCSQPGPGPRRPKGKIQTWNGHLAMQRAGEEMWRDDDSWWLMIHGMMIDDVCDDLSGVLMFSIVVFSSGRATLWFVSRNYRVYQAWEW